MSQSTSNKFEMAVGTSNMLESSMMEGDGFYNPIEGGAEPEQGSNTAWSGVKNDTGQLCRICANSSDYLIPIYEGEGIEHQLELKIQKHLPIQVSSSDTLPIQLCYQCASTLIAWDTMINNCIEAEKKLRSMQDAAEGHDDEDFESKPAEVLEDDHHSDPIDSDDEPLITSKTKVEKSKAAPLKKKILSKAKAASSRADKTTAKSKDKDSEDKERSVSSEQQLPNQSTVQIKVEDGAADVPLNTIDVNMIKEEPAVFECKVCNGVYPTKSSLQKHVKNVHGAEKIQCSVCNAELTKRSYKRHLKKIHGFNDSKPMEEEEENDGKPAEDTKLPLNDLSANTDDNINPCEVLFKVEMSEAPSEELIKKESSIAACQICNQTYSNPLNLKKHIYNVHKMKRVQCLVCDKVVNKKSLDRHMYSVHSANVYVRKERKVIPEEAKIPCHLCDKRCSNMLSLQNHIKNIHDAEQFKCEKCDFQGIKKLLDRHIKKEHNEEIFQCPSCQKVLKSKSTLKEHMWIHTDHRRFICDICGMRFKRTSNYHGHLKSHQEKKFQCQLCGNFFLRKRYLAVHQQTIHDFYAEGVPPQEKGFQCEVCGVKLKWKNNLLAHMRIHTGEKPYKCKICGDEFTCHGSLRTHLSKHAICSTTSDLSAVFQHSYLPPTTP